MNSVGIIPARYPSMRFPGKPLALIQGKPMIQYVVERARQAELLDDVLVATDDERVVKAVQEIGCEGIMTDPGLPSGTDRIAAVAASLDVDIIVNIQGDEPLIPPEDIDKVVYILQNNQNAVMSTLIKQISDPNELADANIVKVVKNKRNEALYFSRHVIPFLRDTDDYEYGMRKHAYYKHIGLYGYRRSFLIEAATWPVSSLENAEKLEQLRILENGYRIHVAETVHTFCGVDVPSDIERVEKLINKVS